MGNMCRPPKQGASIDIINPWAGGLLSPQPRSALEGLSSRCSRQLPSHADDVIEPQEAAVPAFAPPYRHPRKMQPKQTPQPSASRSPQSRSRHCSKVELPGIILGEYTEDSFIGDLVYVHLYELNDTIANLNVALDLLGLGGALHVGVEVLDTEWSFGTKGVSSSIPRRNQYYTYRQTVPMGRTQLPRCQVESTIAAMKQEWQRVKYDLFTRNCGTFCDQLCRRLGVGHLPKWVTRLSETVGQLPAIRALAEAVAESSLTDAVPDAYDRSASLQGASLTDLAPTSQPSFVIPQEDDVAAENRTVHDAPSSSSLRGLTRGSDSEGRPLLRRRCEAFRVEENISEPLQCVEEGTVVYFAAAVCTNKYGVLEKSPRYIGSIAAKGGA